jgi:hypothetical protein
MAKATGEAKKTRKAHVPSSEFIISWEKHSDANSVAAELNMEVGTVLSRASKYRGLGIALKNYPRGGGAKLDLQGAKDLLANLRKTTEVKS